MFKVLDFTANEKPKKITSRRGFLRHSALAGGGLVGVLASGVAPAVAQSIATADGGSFDDTDAPLGWKHSTPESQGIDSHGLIQTVSRVRDEGVNLHSLIMIRNAT